MKITFFLVNPLNTLKSCKTFLFYYYLKLQFCKNRFVHDFVPVALAPFFRNYSIHYTVL